MDRGQVNDIARSAASRVLISQQCKEKGEILLYARETLQLAVDRVAHSKRAEDLFSREHVKTLINQSKALSREVGLTASEAKRLETSISSALEFIDKADYDAAIRAIFEARGDLLDLMFQVVVTCECAEAKAIEEGWKIAQEIGEISYDGEQETIGHQFTDTVTRTTFYGNTVEEVKRELAEKRRLFGSNPGDHVTIGDPGGTTFNEGDLVSREAFEEENERVKKLGERPALEIKE